MAWIRAVTFDLTGTLIHCPRLGEIYAEVLARHGIAVEPGRARRLVHRVWQELDCSAHPAQDRFAAHPDGARGWWRGFVARLCEHLGGNPPDPFAVSELFDRFARPESWELYPEVEAVLDELRDRGLRLGLVSNWDERLPRLVAGLGLAERLDAVVYSQEVGAEKPHPRIFEAALARLDLPAARVVHVGDRQRHDVEGAVAVGMRALLLARDGVGGDLDGLAELPARIGDSGPVVG